MLTSVAFVVCQVSVVGWPGSSVFGFADSDAVGAGITGGAGGGGGGSLCFPHAPRNMIVPSANTTVLHLVSVIVISCFTLFLQSLCARIVACIPQIHGRAHSRPAAKPFSSCKRIYFQLQLGCVLPPLKVSCFTLVPSASMVHIWSLPDRWD